MSNYLLKNRADGTYTDAETMFDGIRILKVDGLTTIGEAINVYEEQWMDGTTDFVIADTQGKIKRKNTDMEIVFIAGDRYLSNNDNNRDPQQAYDAFVEYMTQSDVWVKSLYVGKEVHCYCNGGVTPNTARLKRPDGNSYILASITMRTLETPHDLS